MTTSRSTFQWIMAALGLIMIGIPITLVITQYFGYIPDFTSVSGGPIVIDANQISKFKVQLNFDELMAAKTRLSIMGDTTLMVVAIAGLTIFVWFLIVAMDDKENALGSGEGADWGAIIAKLLVPLIYIIGTPILGISISIAATMMMSRDRNQQQKGYYTLAIAGFMSLVVILVGNRYLLLSTTSWIGYYRYILHMLLSLERGNAIWLMEAIDLIAFFYLMSQTQTDASGQAWKFGMGGFMAVVLGKVPFSNQWVGEFFVTKSVKNYVIYRLITASILIFKEVGMSATGHSGSEQAKFLSFQHSITSLFQIAIIYGLGYGAGIGIPIIFPKISILTTLSTLPPILWLLIAIAITAWIEGRSAHTARPISDGIEKDDHHNLDALGGYFTLGPLRFWNAPLELVCITITTACLFWTGFVAMFFHL